MTAAVAAAVTATGSEPGAVAAAEWAVIARRSPLLADTASQYLQQISVALRPASVVAADNTLRLFCRYLLSATAQPPTGFAAVSRQDIEGFKIWLTTRRGAVDGEHDPPTARGPADVL